MFLSGDKCTAYDADVVENDDERDDAWAGSSDDELDDAWAGSSDEEM